MRLLIKYRLLTFIFVIGLCFYGSHFIPKALEPNNDLEVWFDKNDPALLAYYKFQEEFGNDRIMGLALKEKEGILNPNCLRKISQLQKEIEKIDGVDHVLSLINAKDFKKIVSEGMIRMEFSSLYSDSLYISSPEFENEILTSSLYANRLINTKGDVTLLVIHFESFDLVHSKMDKLIPLIRTLAYKILGQDNVHFSGADIITFGLNELSRRDFIKFTGLSYIAMFLIIALFYRRMIYIVMSLLIAISTIWLTLSIYGFFGCGLNIFTVMTPTFVIIISIMMAMHIINEFENTTSKEFENGSEKAFDCLNKIFWPCLFATITTIVGFLSLLTSSTSIIKEFGWLTSIGCFLALLFAFIWSGIVLPNVRVSNNEIKQTQILGKCMSNFSTFVFSKSTSFFYLSIFILALAIIGILNIKIDMNPIGFFPSNSTVVKDHKFMQNNWGDYYPIDVVLEPKGPFQLDDVSIISSMINFDGQIVNQKLARNTFSYVQVMDRFARVRYQKSLEEILDTPHLFASFTNSFKRLIDSDSDLLVTKDRDKARITITGSLQSVRKLEQSISDLNKISESAFKNNAQIKVSGYPVLFVNIMNTAFGSMKASLLTALFLVFIVTLLLFRDFKTAIIAITVNVFPVLVMLGFLGFSGINLDLATCTIGAIILGIAIDDTIHILYRYQKEKKQGLSVEQALKITHFRIGRVVLLTSVVLLVGFSILLFASLKTVLYFGIISVISVFAIFFGDVILLPLILKKWN